MAWNDPSTWVPNTVLTATQLNAEVRDNFKAIGDVSESYTPEWTASTTNPDIGNGTLAGGYKVAGKRLWIWIRITMGSTTTYGSGTQLVSLPTGLTLATGRWMLHGTARDATDGSPYPLFGLGAGTTFVLRTLPGTAGNSLSGVNGSTPFAFADGDDIFLHGEVELA